MISAHTSRIAAWTWNRGNAQGRIDRSGCAALSVQDELPVDPDVSLGQPEHGTRECLPGEDNGHVWRNGDGREVVDVLTGGVRRGGELRWIEDHRAAGGNRGEIQWTVGTG